MHLHGGQRAHGADINSSGVIAGTIGGTAATYSTASITITDAAGATGTSGAFTWTVKAAPTITAPAAQTTTVGATVNLSVASTCGYPPCSYTLNAVPPGLIINGSGVITGTIGPVSNPPQTYTSTVSITDAAGVKITSGSFTWTVKAPPTVTAPANQSSNIGAVVNVPFSATCANAPCSYTLNNAASLGLTFGAGPTITGTVGGLPQTYTASVTITDAAGVKATSGTFTWTISYPPLLATTPQPQSSTVGTAITALQMTASGGSGSYSWSGALAPRPQHDNGWPDHRYAHDLGLGHVHPDRDRRRPVGQCIHDRQLHLGRPAKTDRDGASKPDDDSRRGDQPAADLDNVPERAVHLHLERRTGDAEH